MTSHNSLAKQGKRKRGFRRRGQSSFEHVMMIAIAMLVLIPVIYMFYSYSKSSTAEIRDASIMNVGRKIINNAESIYYLGEPSRTTLEDSFPDGISNITILGNSTLDVYELVFTLDMNNSLVLSSDVPINGTFDDASVSQGIKNILIESKGSYVNITIK